MRLPLSFVISSVFFVSSTNALPATPAVLEDKTVSTEITKVIETTETVLLSEECPEGSLSPYEATARIPHTILENEQASGTWLGKRDWLSSHGVDLSITYTADIAGNPVGGMRPGGCTYADAFAYACFLNTEKLLGWHGGYLTISALQLNGSNLSWQNIGNLFGVQEIYAMPTIYFVELSCEQKFWEDQVSLKTGRLVANNEFANSPLTWLYMNGGINGNPQALWMSARWPGYFNAAWGSRLKVDLPGSTVARLGVYQMTPYSQHGLNWNFYSNDGIILVAQYGWNPEFFKTVVPETVADSSSKPIAIISSPQNNAPNRHAEKPVGTPSLKGFVGHYWMGGYYSTWEYPQFNSGFQTSNAYGLYWHMDQTVYRPKPQNDEGLILWSDCVLCPQQNLSLVPFQINAGVIYTGLIPGRRNDFTVWGVEYGNFSKDYANLVQQSGQGNPTYELVYELGYRVTLTKFAYVQPNLQWIIRPAGTGTIPNALVLGAEMGVVF